MASWNGNASTVTILLNEGADIEAKTSHVSILDDHTEYINRIHVISDLMTIIDMQGGWTALIWASGYGRQSVCQLLLTRGADMDTKDNVSILDDHTECIYRIHVISDLMTIIDMQLGFTALILASRFGHLSICQLLLTRGADIDSKNNVSILDDHT